MWTHELKIGDFRAIVINDGASTANFSELKGRFPSASAAEFEEASRFADAKGYTGNGYMNILYLEANGEKIIVDTGMGASSQRPEYGKLLERLNELGISPEAISIVYLTHFHGDHISGLMNAELIPNFPNARYFTQQSEWDAWMNPEKLEAMGEGGKRMTSIFEPLKEKFQFLQNGESITDGVSVVDCAGHTLGHSGLLIESQGENLLHLVDLLHHPVQMKFPQWYHMFDSDKDLAVKSRKERLAYAADKDIMTLFYHLPFPALGKIARVGDSFEWQAIG